MLSDYGGVISHEALLSTFCTRDKHILSLDGGAVRTQLPAMHIGQRIKIARERNGFSQVDLAEAIGKGQTTISSWERGRTEPTRHDVQKIADSLRLPASDIEGSTSEEPAQRRFREVPVISWVSAGQISEAGDIRDVAGRYAERLLITDLPEADYFATDVRGDSMDRISPEGSRIIVNASDKNLHPGKCYLFSLRGEATYKRYQSEPVIRFEPYSTNPANQTIYPKADKDWLVIGRVVRSYIDLE